MKQTYDLRILPRQAASESELRRLLSIEADVSPQRITTMRITRRSIDARQRTVMVNLRVDIWIDGEQPELRFTPIEYPFVGEGRQVVIVGAGPAGLFAALRCIELGMRPLVIERGQDVHRRRRDIAQISREQRVDPESNYAFGEGGAGAFSDGKLYTRSKKRGNTEKILRVFCQHGASESILVDAHPHIGTDRLPGVIERMRHTIEYCGGEVLFGCRMTELLVDGDRVLGVATAGGLQLHGPVILATGHSARDVYRHLHGRGLQLEAKDIAVGVRVEHPAEVIDRIQYHSAAGRGQFLPAAEYSFTGQVEGRGVYSFCMCPGGVIVPAATGDKQLVVNGMSPSNRGGRWSNSGMVVELHVSDVTIGGAANPLCMLEFQEQLEELAWQQAGCTQQAPAQRLTDFIAQRPSTNLPPSSYAPGTTLSPLHRWLPEGIARRLRLGLTEFGRRAQGFATPEAMLLGVETRTSAPVRIVRGADNLMHPGLHGLFPCGEGAGYAGGIVSAAMDGERCAESVYATFCS